MVLDHRTVGPVEENSYLVGDERAGQAVLIDPGDDPAELQRMVDASALAPIAILNTHGHVDHIGAAEHFQRTLGIPFHLHEADVFLLPLLAPFRASLGLPPVAAPRPDRFLEPGGHVALGDLDFTVLHTPGHTPGGVCFYLEKQRVLFAGDTLFAGSVGRTDLPGGSFPQLLEGIQARLLTLPDDVVVYSGHGPRTTIGRERRANPFLLEAAKGRLA